MSRETKFEYLKRAVAEHVAAFGHLPPKEQPCLEWPWGRNGHGYGRVWAEGSKRYAHRIARDVSGRPIAPGLLGCHSCDNTPCFNPAHIFDGTDADNLRDAAAKGRNASQRYPGLRKGERHGRARLTDEKVLLIRSAVAKGETQCSVAVRLGVSHATVSRVVRFDGWGHVA